MPPQNLVAGAYLLTKLAQQVSFMFKKGGLIAYPSTTTHRGTGSAMQRVLAGQGRMQAGLGMMGMRRAFAMEAAKAMFIIVDRNFILTRVLGLCGFGVGND